jgi:hypothetical protein
MKRLIFSFMLLLFCATVGLAQYDGVNAQRIYTVTGAPVGPCLKGPIWTDFRLRIDTTPATLLRCKIPAATDATAYEAIAGAGAGIGDVVGPASATDNAFARFDATTGKLIQNSLVTADDNGSVNIPTGQTYKINGVAIPAGTVTSVSGTSPVNVATGTTTPVVSLAIPGTKFASDYASLNAAVTAIGSTPTILVVNAGFALGTSPVTVPSTLSLQVDPGGSITGTGALTVNGSLEKSLTNPSQIFASTITVTLGNGQRGILPEWWGVLGDGSTNNATAWLRVTTAAATAKTARIILQNATYVGRVSIPATSGAEWQSIEIDGPTHPAMMQGTLNGGHVPTTHGAILVSTGTGGAVVSAAGSYVGSVTLKNLTLRTYDDPNEIGFDGTLIEQAVLEQVEVDTGVYTSAVTEPTHSTASGIIFPVNGNSSLNIGRDLLVQGYYNGIVWTEHTELDYVQIAACENAILLPGNTHPLYGTRVLVDNSKYSLTFTNTQAGTLYIHLTQFAVEHGVNAGFPAWQATTYDINDASNVAYGVINYRTSGPGGSNILINGGSHLKLNDMTVSGNISAVDAVTGVNPNVEYRINRIGKAYIGVDNTTDNIRILNSDANGAASIFSLTQAGNGTVLGTLGIGGGSAITSSGAGGALGSNAFSSTSYFPLAGGTITGATTFSSAPITLSGNISAAAWTTNGIRIKGVAATFTDTTSSGTVATAYTDVIGGNTIAASSATTFTNYHTLFINIPVAGSNVTITRKYALGLGGALQIANGSPILPSADGTTALNLANAAGTPVVTVDTTNGILTTQAITGNTVARFNGATGSANVFINSATGQNPNVAFSVNSVNKKYFGVDNSTGNFRVLASDAGSNATLLTLTDVGVLNLPGLGTSSAATTGTLCWTTGTGLVNVDTTTTCLLSASKFKERSQPLFSGLDTVLKLQPKSYFLKDEFNPAKLGEQIGFFAEDVAKVDSRLVSLEEDGSPHAVRYQQMTAVLAKAIQELNAKVEAQRKEIDALKATQENLTEWKRSFVIQFGGLRIYSVETPANRFPFLDVLSPQVKARQQ